MTPLSIGIALAAMCVVVALLRRREREPEPEPEPEPAPPPAPPVLALSEDTRAKLLSLDFQANESGDDWYCRVTEPGTQAAIKYSAAYVPGRGHSVSLYPDNLRARTFLLSELELAVESNSDNTSDLYETLLVPVPGVVVELARCSADGAAMTRTPASPEDVARCQQLLDAGLIAQFKAVPHAKLRVNLHTPNEYEILLDWPEVDARSGPRVGDAVALLRAVAAKLSEARAA